MVKICCGHVACIPQKVGWQDHNKGQKVQCSAHLAGWCKLPARRMSQTASGHHPAGIGNAIPPLLLLTDQMLLCNVVNIISGKQLRNDPVRIGSDAMYTCLYSVESMFALVTLMLMIACNHDTADIVDSPLCCLMCRSVVLFFVVCIPGRRQIDKRHT